MNSRAQIFLSDQDILILGPNYESCQRKHATLRILSTILLGEPVTSKMAVIPRLPLESKSSAFNCLVGKRISASSMHHYYRVCIVEVKPVGKNFSFEGKDNCF